MSLPDTVIRAGEYNVKGMVKTNGTRNLIWMANSETKECLHSSTPYTSSVINELGLS